MSGLTRALAGLGGGGGSGSGVNATYTAATLDTMRSAGTLTALTLYAASDTGALYWASSVSSLDPMGGTVYVQESATAFSIATAALTAIGTGGQFDVRGYSTFGLSYKNAHSTSLTGFEIAVKQGSGAWEVTHSTAADFASGDDLLVDVTTDDTDLDVTTLTNGKTAYIRLDVRGVDYVRIRAQQGTSDGTCDWYSTKES